MGDILTNKRRVQLTGISTLSVSLPKDWARRFNIRKGTELSLSDIGDGSILITTESVQNSREKVQIIIDEFPSSEELRRKFIAMYLDGYNAVHFKSGKKISHEARQTILTEVRRLIGMEVVDENPNEIVVQDFFSYEGLSVEKSLKRAHLLATSMYEEFLACLQSRAVSNAEKIASRDDEIDRLKFLLLRQLSLALRNAKILRELDLSTSDCVNYAVVIRNVEHIGDKLTKALKYFSEVARSRIPENSISHIIKISKDVCNVYTMAISSFLKRDTKSANQVIYLRKQLLAQQETLERSLLKNSRMPFQYSMVLEYVMDIAESSAEIAEVTINRG